jgi:CHAT domain-containing protein
MRTAPKIFAATVCYDRPMRVPVRCAGLLLLACAFSVSAQPAPETSTPRDAAVRFLRAFGDGDAGAAIAEWKDSAATRELRGDLEQQFRARCIEIRSLDVVSVAEEKTTARVDLDFSFVDRPRRMGRIRERTERHRIDLERDGSWKIVAWRTAEEDLLERMEATKDDAAAAALLAQESRMVDEPLVEALVRHFDRAASRRRMPGMQFAARWMQRLAAQIDTPAVWAMAIPITVEMARRPAAAREPLRARLRQGIAFAEEANDPDSLAASLNMLGVLYMDEDESSSEAMSCYERSLSMRDSLVRCRNVIVALQSMGGCLFARQDYRKSYQRFQEALAYSRNAHRLAAAAFHELYLGRIYERENDPELAIEHYEQGLHNEPWNSVEVMLHLGQSAAYRSLGNVQQSDSHLERALSRATADHLPGLVGAALNAKSDAAALRGDAAGAAALAQEALLSARSARYQPAEMDALLTQAWLHHRAGRFEEALRVLDEATALSKSADFPGAEHYLIRLLAGRSQARLGRTDEAIRSYREAIARIEEVRSNVTGDERESRLFFEPFETAYSELVALLVERGQPEEAFRIAEQAKARVLLDALGGTRTEGDALLPETDRREWNRRLEALQSANRKLIEAGQDEHRKPSEAALHEEARRARTALDDLQVRLAVQYPHYGRARGGATLIEPAQLNGLVADPDLALVEYVVQNAAVYAFVIARDANGAARIHVRRLPIGRASLESTIARYTRQLAARDLSYRRLSRRLHALLIAPLEPWLRGRKVIGIAPAGPLWRLSFASLVQPDGRFLVEEHALFFVPSLSIYRQLALDRRGDATPRLVAFADPVIGEAGRRPVERERGARLSALPEARAEVRQIAQLYGRASRVYTGAAASEERAKAQIGSADIIHFATHGLADDRSPMYSYILLAPGTGGREDGVLEAWEVMQLDLRAELAVLSACETARGRVSTGEGLVGLSWALFLAGCPSTAATLWRVSSAAAAEEMVAFHRHRIGSGGTAFRNARSLRAAQREAIRDPRTRHPFYWAAFVVLGRP